MKKLSLVLLTISIFGCKNTPSTTAQYKDIVDAVFASGSTQAKEQYKITAYADGYLQQSLVAEDDSVRSGWRSGADVHRPGAG